MRNVNKIYTKFCDLCTYSQECNIRYTESLIPLDYRRWNYLEDVSFLRDLKGLTSLDLSWNGLKDVSLLRELKGLTYLDLRYNKLKDISFLEDEGLDHLTDLYVDANPIKTPPPEIVKQGLPAIRDYFRAIHLPDGEPSILSNDVVKPGDRQNKRERTDPQIDESKRSNEELKRLSKEIEDLETGFQKEENLKKFCDDKAEKHVKRLMWRFYKWRGTFLIYLGVFNFLTRSHEWEKWVDLSIILIGIIQLVSFAFTSNKAESKARHLEREKEKQYVSNRFNMDEYERIKNALENARNRRRRLL